MKRKWNSNNLNFCQICFIKHISMIRKLSKEHSITFHRMFSANRLEISREEKESSKHKNRSFFSAKKKFSKFFSPKPYFSPKTMLLKTTKFEKFFPEKLHENVSIIYSWKKLHSLLYIYKNPGLKMPPLEKIFFFPYKSGDSGKIKN